MRLLASFLWSASVLLAACAPADGSQTAQRLTVEEIADDQTVSRWLARHVSAANRTEPASWFEQGVQAKKRKNWSAAAKAFGESAIRFPGPEPLSEYASAELRMLGEIRARNRNYDEHKAPDLAHALRLYKSALAANVALNTLAAPDGARLQANVGCLGEYLRTQKHQPDCPALLEYGIRQ